jgi:hypothetical protein
MSKYEKYMKLLVFKMLSSSDHTAASKEILLMIGDELPPQYKSVFVNATNTLFEKISK